MVRILNGGLIVNSLMHVKKIVYKLVPIAFYALLVAFLVLYLRSIDLNKLSHVRVSLLYVIIASVLSLFARFFSSGIWFVILRSLGADIAGAKTQLVYIYAKSWLGRYIPGTAPWILGKIYFASQHGISKNKLAVSSLLEGGIQIVVTLVIACGLLFFSSRIDVIGTNVKLAMAGITIAGVIVLVPAIFNRVISFAYRLLRKKTLDVEHLVTHKTIVRGALLYAVLVVISGLSYFFISKSVYSPLSYDSLLFVVGATSLAASVSMLAIFAPGGLGVRESILLVLLGLIMPKELALAVTVVSRLWSVIIDFLFFGLARLLRRAEHH